MPFLVLTRQGFDDLVARLRPAAARLYLNPGIASEAELEQLRAAGARVEVMAAPLDPDQPGDAGSALDAAGALWVERAAGRPSPVVAQAQAQTPAAQSGAGGRRQALRQRLAGAAGMFARQALQRLRTPGGRRLMLLPYLGFGNAHTLWIRGRVLDEYAFREQTRDDSGWHNLVALYRRLEADEVAGARVVARFQGRSYDTVTDAGGYFAFEIAAGTPLAGGAHRVELALALVDTRAPDGAPVTAVAEAIVLAETARFGIISDIDDTVLWTNVTNKLNMALMLARTNAHTRKPFKGVAAFYRALRDGLGGNEANPVFYVSSSPWHLYGPLVDFLRIQDIPLGPLLLREIGLRDVFKLNKHGNHKLDKIELILRFYPQMQFVLIGDSGERDPEIYAEILRRHPHAVRMIYIRNVNPDPARIDALDALIEEVSSTGAQLVLAPDSVFAASHAAAEGLIHVDRLATVRQDKREDEGKPALA